MVLGSSCPPISGLTWIKGDAVEIPSSDAVLVLEFWATWCPPCKATIPHLTKLQQKYKAQGVRIIGISTVEDATKAQQFVQNMGSNMDYTVALDTGKQAYELMNRAGAHGIPHAFVVDRSGTIKYSGHPADPKFEQVIQEAVAVQPAPEPQALPLITESYEELMARSAKELKTILTDRGINIRDCIEKGDFAKKIIDTCSTVTYYK